MFANTIIIIFKFYFISNYVDFQNFSVYTFILI